MLAHLVDVSDSSGRPDPVEDFRVINNELANFADGSEHPLAEKPMIVVATKIDAVNPAKLKKLAGYAKRRKLEFHADLGGHGRGIDELKWALERRVRPAEEAESSGKARESARTNFFPAVPSSANFPVLSRVILSCAARESLRIRVSSAAYGLDHGLLKCGETKCCAGE